ncbi:hypothetical protein E1B28_000306 [Marasmius oreades]|uniref:Beta-galactosidase n=1 Tax=Marasmius oreades TaxID=181124 RepID=A0A9P7V167_9AGAR|nr:uncharacterized protein E1B28_000306 [Marasmius oreades]KAG7098347.1 hypothetical protein E1B28_000306 [Marasmius oreades]
MRWLILLLQVILLAGVTFSSASTTRNLNLHSLDRRSTCTSDGLCNSGTTAVQWDKHSFVVQGRRMVVWSGEFHFWRLPVPDLWRDILQKFKAAGLNTVSTYVHWGATNPTEGHVEWDGYRNFELFMEIAHEVGLWVIARPGPYINGESSAGGIPGRVTNIAGFLRSNDSDYHESYQQYYREAVNIIKRHQISEGGPVILFQVENEYTNNTEFATPNPVTKNQYMQALEDILHELGIVVPLISNDSYMGRNFAPGVGLSIGQVDVYAMDAYPQGSCATPLLWSGFPVGDWDYHQSVNPTQPWLMPEFQGGSFLGWGPGSPTYEDCNVLTGVDFEQVYYLNQFATGVKGQNIYMTYGGTSWGFFGFPGVYTSYDYGASIAEDRTLTRKWFELKNLGMFIRSVEDDLARVVNISQISDVTSPPPGYTDNRQLFVTELRNPENNAGFYVIRHLQTSSFAKTSSKIRISTSAGKFTVPQTSDLIVTLDGRQSRVILTDHVYGNSRVLYSTASLFYSATIGLRDVAVFHGPAGQSFEMAIKTGSNLLRFSGSLKVSVDTKTIAGYTLLTFSPAVGQTAVSIANDAIVILGDASAMDLFHSPVLPGRDGSIHFGVGSNKTVLVQGPHLVRNATFDESVKTIRLSGDTNSTTQETVTVYADQSVDSVVWNGKHVETKIVAPGILMFRSSSTLGTITVPELKGWKYADGLPEVQKGYDDSKWVVADRENSTNPFVKYYGKYYLYACEYGFCEGPVLWRGHFGSEGLETAVNLSITGGRAFAGSVWLNNVFLGSTFGASNNNNVSAIIETTNRTYAFPDGAIVKGQNNVITVLHDNMGMEEARANQFSEWLKTPRGIQGYFLLNATRQPTWKVQGKLGGYSNFPDRVRGVMNEGGTFGERAGWHLPGFDDSSWESRPLEQGFSTAGIGVFRTMFDLDIPSGSDVVISVNFPPYGNGTYRAFLYVNGWNMGRYVANMGPQTRFPIPEGILDYQGTNTLAIVLWATGSSGARVDSLKLSVDRVTLGGIGKVSKNNPIWERREVF